MAFAELTDAIVNKINAMEGIFDTPQYKKFVDKHGELPGELTPEEQARINSQLAFPCALPQDFDGTLEAWLLRISIWGKIKITHKNPDIDLNKPLTDDQFLDYMVEQERDQFYGNFAVEEMELNKIRFHRQFYGIKGRNVTEEILVEIDLRPDLKDKLKQFRRSQGLFGF